MKVISYTLVFLLTRLRQIVSVCSAILKREISYYPSYLLKFENRCANYFGTKHALSYCNGTSAIEAAMFALGIQEGDEVLVPSCTFHASIDPIVNMGAKPIFVDVDEESFTLCPKDLKEKITSKSKAIVVVHIFGIPADMESIKKIAREHEIAIIEDASHAHGGKFDGTMLGNHSDIAVFSLQGNKAVAGGEGGIALTNNEESFLKMSLFGHFNRHAGDFHKIGASQFKSVGLGYKRRMAPISALIANADLHYLDQVNEMMLDSANILDQELSKIDGIDVSRCHPKGTKGGFCNGYPIKISKLGVTATDAIQALQRAGIDSIPYPFPPQHKLRCYVEENARILDTNSDQSELVDENHAVKLPVTEELADTLLLLPRSYLVTLNTKKLGQISQTLSQL